VAEYHREAVFDPPVTITCECGAVERVKYGESWTCPGCGRVYDTSRIPVAAYRERTQIVSRYRLLTLGPLLVLAAIMVPLVVFVDSGLIFLLGMLAFAYILLFLPLVRRRVRRSVTEAPAWDLPAD
jgi:hypothetical protein